MTCHPEALFRCLLDDPEFAELEHIWVLRDFEQFASTMARYKDHPRVRFVRYGSHQYYWALITSKYLVNNVTFPQQFSKRDGQIYLATWHGVPLKKMGYDVAGKAVDARNIVRNFLAADYLLSAGPHMTNDMYLDAFKMRNIFPGKIIEAGNPRTDRQVTTDASSAELATWLAESGIELDDRSIILYAPTWKGASYFHPANDAARIRAVVEQIEQSVDPARFRILVKAHQVVARRLEGDPELAGKVVSNATPSNLVLTRTSVLVTDYSSIFYDFLATGRPILFHIPDIEQFRRDRDIYLDPEDFPGPCSRSASELIENLTEVIAPGYQPRGRILSNYEQAASSYSALDDGGASERVIDIVFRGSQRPDLVREGFSDGREKLLIYIGGMTSNGITSSALNLLDNIDYTRYDVTALYAYSRSEEKRRNARAINPAVRALPRDGTFNATYLTGRRRAHELRIGWTDDLTHRYADVDRMWREEWRRCFGNASFDYIVDFVGYSPFWDYLLLKGKAKTHSIWLHNDLAADADRTVNGAQPLSEGLRAVFRTYARFDNLVSVSPALRAINAEKLAGWADETAFTSCINMINAEKLRRLAYGNLDGPDSNGGISLAIPPISTGPNVVEEIARLARQYSLHDIRQEVGRMQHAEGIVPTDPSGTTFVAVGRLSPEKNHARLIRAFSQVHRECPQTRLVIIGGGPLYGDLRRLVNEVNLSGHVTLVGAHANPYLFMARSDCFVMSSDYEGQPMVILEALTLGLPIVTTRFGSVDAALPDGSGLVVDQSDDALAEGMREFLNGKVPAPTFDPEKYNEMAIEQFYAAIGASRDADLVQTGLGSGDGTPAIGRSA